MFKPLVWCFQMRCCMETVLVFTVGPAYTALTSPHKWQAVSMSETLQTKGGPEVL